MADYFEENISRLLFERDLKDVQLFSNRYLYYNSNSMEGVIVDRLKNKGYSINKWSLFLALTIWEYNTFLHSHLYSKTSNFISYQEALKRQINDFCKEEKIPYQVFQEIESIYNWKSTRRYAAEYSAPVAVSYKNNNDEEVEFDNYWDVCTPEDSSLIPVGLFLHDMIGYDVSIIDKEFLEKIEQIDLHHNYVEILGNNLRRNLVETLFYSVQCNNNFAKLVFEALEVFVPSTFNQKVESIIAPLASILGSCYYGHGYLVPMEYIKEEFSPDVDIVCDDLMYDKKPISIRRWGKMASLVEQWSNWRWFFAPSDDLCNMVFALVFGMQDGKEPEYNYYFKKVRNQNCQLFLEDIVKLKNICASLDADTLDSYLEDRIVDYGFVGYANEDGLWHVLGPPRDINTIVCDLDFPLSSTTLQTDNDNPIEKQPIQAAQTSSPQESASIYRDGSRCADEWPLPTEFFEPEYQDHSCPKDEYIHGFLSHKDLKVDFSLAPLKSKEENDLGQQIWEDYRYLSVNFSALIDKIAEQGYIKDTSEDKLALAHALTGRRVKKAKRVLWEKPDLTKSTDDAFNGICFLTQKLHGGKYGSIVRVFDGISRDGENRTPGGSYAKNANPKFKEIVESFVNSVKALKVIYIESPKPKAK